MGTRFFSDAKRPVHKGPYPLERLLRTQKAPALETLPPFQAVPFTRAAQPESIVNAMSDYMATMDAIRDGLVNKTRAEIPDDLRERANHLKGFGYFSDASMVGIGPMSDALCLTEPLRNPDIDRLARNLRTRQTKTLASGIDMIMGAGFNWAPPSVLVDTMGVAAAVSMIEGAGLGVPAILATAA